MDKSASDPGLRNNSESAEQLDNEQITQLGRSEEVEDLTVSILSQRDTVTYLPNTWWFSIFFIVSSSD